MVGVSPGTSYFIGLVGEPQPLVGVENPDGEWQIVTNTHYNTWAVEGCPEFGGYYLDLAQPPLFSRNDDDGNVIGDVNPPSIAWIIVKEDEGYTIQLPDSTPPLVWTVAKLDDVHCPVTLEVLQEQTPHENQLWKFTPVDEK